MSSWYLLPHVIVRTTGFPFDLLGGLQQSQTVEAARGLLRANHEHDSLRRTGMRLRRPPRQVLAALKAGRRVEHADFDSGQFDAWNAVADRAAHADAVLDDRLACEGQQAELHLRTLVRDSRFLEAIAVSCPPIYRDVSGDGAWNKRLRRQVVAFVQRFCTKNETTSFFGPINYGRVDERQPGDVLVRWSGPAVLRQRRAHVAYWIMQQLVRTISSDPEIVGWLVLRAKTFARPPRGLVGSDQDLLARLLQIVDGHRSLRALAAAMELPIEELAPAAQLAFDRGLVTHQLAVAPAHIDPLAELVERVAGIPGDAARRYVAEIQHLCGLLQAFCEGDSQTKVELNGRFGLVLEQSFGIGASPMQKRDLRGDGPHFYADRLPLREECVGDLQLRVGGGRAAEITRRLQGPLDILATAAVRTRRKVRAVLASEIGRATVPLYQLVRSYRDRPVAYDEDIWDPILPTFDRDAQEVRLSSADFSQEADLHRESLVCSVDILIAAASEQAWGRGDYQLVLGEVHDTMLVWNWALQFHEHRQAVVTEVVSALGRMARPLPIVSILASRRGLVPAEYPGPVVELGGTSMRPTPWLLPLDDLVVHSDGVDVCLRSKSLDSEVLLYNGELESFVHTAFAIPRLRSFGLDLGDHTPRVCIDDVVVRRRSWRLDEAEVQRLLAAKTERGQLLEVLRLWDGRKIPAVCFASFPGERKPVFLDVQSPALIAVYLNLLRLRKGCVLREMLPGPGQLWLRSPTGHHTSELRCAFIRHGESP